MKKLIALLALILILSSCATQQQKTDYHNRGIDRLYIHNDRNDSDYFRW